MDIKLLESPSGKLLGRGTYGCVYDTKECKYEKCIIKTMDFVTLCGEFCNSLNADILDPSGQYHCRISDIGVIKEPGESCKDYEYSITYEYGGNINKISSLKHIKELFQCIKWLRTNNLIHLDIKSNNVVIDEEDKLRLIDFGIAADSSDKFKILSIAARMFIGEYGYIYPFELVSGSKRTGINVYNRENYKKFLESQFSGAIIRSNRNLYKLYRDNEKNVLSLLNSMKLDERVDLLNNKIDIFCAGILISDELYRNKISENNDTLEKLDIFIEHILHPNPVERFDIDQCLQFLSNI